MSCFVDSSVWSLALRADQPSAARQVRHLAAALARGDEIVTTGLVIQELLQGFAGPEAEAAIIERLAALRFVTPERDDHVHAAALRNHCRRHGVQVGTIDALLAQLCLRHDLVMLTTDLDFEHIARFSRLQVWQPPAAPGDFVFERATVR